MQVIRRPQPNLQGALEWWWLFRVVPVETSSPGLCTPTAASCRMWERQPLGWGNNWRGTCLWAVRSQGSQQLWVWWYPTASTTSPLESWPRSIVSVCSPNQSPWECLTWWPYPLCLFSCIISCFIMRLEEQMSHIMYQFLCCGCQARELASQKCAYSGKC